MKSTEEVFDEIMLGEQNGSISFRMAAIVKTAIRARDAEINELNTTLENCRDMRNRELGKDTLSVLNNMNAEAVRMLREEVESEQRWAKHYADRAQAARLHIAKFIEYYDLRGPAGFQLDDYLRPLREFLKEQP